jgi:aminoglycoside phosphotransferase (APT) family kinase protein
MAVSVDLSQLAEDARRIVHFVLDRRVETVDRLDRGVMTYKYITTLGTGDSWIVRFYPPSREWVSYYEADVLRRCASIDVPVPHVIADARTGPAASLPYLVYRFIPGVPLSTRYGHLSSEDHDRIALTLADWLPRLHQLACGGFGDLIDGQTAACVTWRSFLEHSVRTGLDSVRRDARVKPGRLAAIERLSFEVTATVEEPAAGLVWSDVSLENILVDESGRIIGLIDFESMLSGDPTLSLGYCFAAYGQHEFLKSLMRAWPGAGEVAPERIQQYAMLRWLRLVRFANEPLPTRAPRLPAGRVLPGAEAAIEKLCRHTPGGKGIPW